MPIDKTFAYHKPKDAGMRRVNELRAEFSALLEVVNLNCPNSREKSIALTNLEQAAMWAIKSVVSNDPDSEVQD